MWASCDKSNNLSGLVLDDDGMRGLILFFVQG